MIIALQPVLTGSPINVGAIAGLLIFSMVCFAALTFFVRGAVEASQRQRSAPRPPNPGRRTGNTGCAEKIVHLAKVR